jgi:ABC-type glycerol-3-phosphate transport system substrate-binding protein
MSSRIALGLSAALLAAACSNEAGSPSAEQNREMENAAEMLDEAPRRLSEIDDRELLQDSGNLAEQENGAPRQ